MTHATMGKVTGLVLLACAGGVVAGRALATGAPVQTPLTYGGVITDKDGKPYAGPQDVSLSFYDKADATTPKCTAPTVQAEGGTGRFSVVLPAECAQAVHDAPDLWTEAVVGAGKVVLPRTHVGAVPYALEADSAKQAVGAAGPLKATIDGVVADVAGLKGTGGPKPPSVTLLKGDMGADLPLNSSGGVLQFVANSQLYCNGGMVSFGAIPLLVDGVTVGKIPAGAPDGLSHVPFSGTVFAQVASGAHVVKFAPGNTCVCWDAGNYAPCSFQVIEFKP